MPVIEDLGIAVYPTDFEGRISVRDIIDTMLAVTGGAGPNLLARLMLLENRVTVLEGGTVIIPGTFARRATLSTDTTAHDGHSLVDAYVHTGPWPGSYRSMRNSIMEPASYGADDTLVAKSTIPGSPIYWRLGYQIDGSYHPEQRSDFNADRSPFKEVTTTEAGAPFRVGMDAEKQRRSLEYLIEFCELALAEGDNGNGARVNLWSIWPQIDGWVNHPEFHGSWGVLGGFEECLPEYGRSFKFMADYANWKMRQLHPDLPEDWHVHVFPGHLWWARICRDLEAGLVPGFTTLAEMMHPADSTTFPNLPIHPGHVAGYGLAALALTCHYQANLTHLNNTLPGGVYIQEAYVETRPEPEEDIQWPAVSREFAEYCWRVAWDIATTYGPAGMGGTEGNELVFRGGIDPDPLAVVPPVDSTSPAVVMGAASRAMLEGGQWAAGLNPNLVPLAGTGAPVARNGYLEFRGSVIGGAMAASGARYGIAVIRADSVSEGIVHAPLKWANDQTTSWNASRIVLTANAFTSSWAMGEGTMAAQSVYALGQWQTVEFWVEDEQWHIAVNGGAVQSVDREGAIPSTTVLMLGGGTSYGSPDNPLNMDLAALFLCDGVPTPEQRADLRGWAGTQIPAA